MARYRLARAKGKDAYEQVYREDFELLAWFGLRLLAVDGCVRAAVEAEIRGTEINPWTVIEINMKAWDWMQPLLVELKARQSETGIAGSPELFLAAAK
jgi:hypothetical protein